MRRGSKRGRHKFSHTLRQAKRGPDAENALRVYFAMEILKSYKSMTSGLRIQSQGAAWNGREQLADLCMSALTIPNGPVAGSETPVSRDVEVALASPLPSFLLSPILSTPIISFPATTDATVDAPT